MVFERIVVERCIIERRIQRYEEAIVKVTKRLRYEEAQGHNCDLRQMSKYREEIIILESHLQHARAELVQASVTALCG